MKKVIDRTGETNKNKEGLTMIIVYSDGSRNNSIKFENGYVAKNKSYRDFKTGEIKNKLHPSIYGVGYEGEGKYSSKENSKIYRNWADMLKRCYSTNINSHNSTYILVEVCEEWHNFQNFAKWFEKNYKDGFQLDKDVLMKGSKIYSPETCCFLPKEVNLLFTKADKFRGCYPIGVCASKNRFRATCNVNGKSKHLGYFNTPEEAFQAYKTAKEQEIKRIANKWKPLITPQTYQALINYKVSIED